MDVRLTAEQQQLRDAAAKLGDDLGPGAVQDLDDQKRIALLDKQIELTGWGSLRADGASGVEWAVVPCRCPAARSARQTCRRPPMARICLGSMRRSWDRRRSWVRCRKTLP